MIGRLLCVFGLHRRPDGINLKWTFSWQCTRRGCTVRRLGELGKRIR